MDKEHLRHQEDTRQVLHRLSRQATLGLSALVGVMAGVLAVVFQLLINATESTRGMVRAQLTSHGYLGGAILILGGAALGAFSVFLTRRYCPEAAGSGIPHVKAVLLSARRLRPKPLVAVKLVGGLLALAAGMSLGREGPTVHIGAACAAYFAALLKLPHRTRRSLIAAGAGAGLAAAFNAPLAGFLFIMEELRRDMSRETYGNALVTSVTSVLAARALLGSESDFSLTDVATLPLSVVPAVLLTGLLASVVGVTFNRTLLTMVEWRESSRPVVLGAMVGILGGVLAIFLPSVTGGGHDLTLSLLEGQTPHWLGLLVILLVVKLVFTTLSFSSGVPGGILAPLLTLGALTGGLVGAILRQFSTQLAGQPTFLATVGMAAVLSASVRAPLTGVVLIVEMTGQYHLLYFLLLASFISYLAAEWFEHEPIYEALLSRELHRGKAWVDSEEARVLELSIEPGSRLDRARIDHYPLPHDVLIALIEREGKPVVPNGKTRLLSGDFLTVVAGPHCDDHALAEILDASRAP
ncbi:MAG: H(+)/Cl(-) exchange transporter ClcA [Candidatus Eremiobacteraeota bacterium]|nr:H(+)/Cl(-) exchange transporter ClcA [Candidatus Eremiobacteraeota bacterium]